MKICSICFDDGDPRDAVLGDFGRAAKIPFTFFLIGGRYESEAKLKAHFGTADMAELQKWYDGHEIGSHGYQHWDMSSPTRTPREFFQEFMGGAAYLRRAFELKTPIQSYAFPYGLATEQCLIIWNIIRACGVNYPDINVRMYQDKYSFVRKYSFAWDIKDTLAHFIKTYNEFGYKAECPLLLAGHAGDAFKDINTFKGILFDMQSRGYEFFPFKTYCALCNVE